MSNLDGAAAGGTGGVPAFLDDAAGCFSAIASRPPSQDLWGLLTGTAASCMKEEGNAQLCALYLQAVAQQLPASDMTVAAAGMDDAGNSNSNNMEFEMMRAQRLMEVLDAVSLAASRVNPRHLISQSGILRALVNQPGFKTSYLTQIQVEFCQIALLAGQYRYASQCFKSQWPRPTSTISVRHVLRYFLLRGAIHVGCNDWTLAVRCFWTCLSIPSEIVSLLVISAWKKLALVQCLSMEDDDYRAAQEHQMKLQQDAFGPTVGVVSQQAAAVGGGNGRRGPLSLPKAVPNCVSRFLTMASNETKKQQQQLRRQQAPEEIGMVQEELGESTSQQQPQQAGNYPSMGVKVYMDLVHAFVAGDQAEFDSLLNQNTVLFDADGNLGLVRQCETAMIHRQVYQLSRMYSVIPITDLAAKLHMDVEKTKGLLQQLSLETTISATAVHTTKWPSIEVEADGMVVFDFEKAAASSTPTDPTSHDVMSDMMLMEDKASQSELENNIAQLMKLTQDVEKLDVSIGTSPMYHAMMRRSQDSKMSGPRGVEEL